MNSADKQMIKAYVYRLLRRHVREQMKRARDSVSRLSGRHRQHPGQRLRNTSAQFSHSEASRPLEASRAGPR